MFRGKRRSPRASGRTGEARSEPHFWGQIIHSRPRFAMLLTRQFQQADLVVMVQRADGYAGPPRELANLESVRPHGDPSCGCLGEHRPRRNGTTSRYVRIKGGFEKKEKKSREHCLPAHGG